MEPKTTAAKAHAAGLVTGAASLAAAWITGTLDQSMINAFMQTAGLAAAAWIGTYYAPANKLKP